MKSPRFLPFLLILVLTFSFCSLAAASPPSASEPFELGLQALKGKEQTDLYLKVSPATGGYAPPDMLKKVQLKSVAPDGKPLPAANWFDVPSPAGISVIAVTYAERYQTLETKVHVKTDQTVKEEVLTGETTVLLRPDLVVDEIVSPKTGNVDVPFPITVKLKEINGDIGANTNVEILDGTNVVGTVAGVPVEKGGIKEAVFNLTLGSPGTYTLKANISGASPGEYDTTNNEKTFTVTIVEDVKPMQYESSYQHIEHYTENSDTYFGTEVSPQDTPLYKYRNYGEKESLEMSLFTPDDVNLSGDFNIKLYTENGLAFELTESDIESHFDRYYQQLRGFLKIDKQEDGTRVTLDYMKSNYHHNTYYNHGGTSSSSYTSDVLMKAKQFIKTEVTITTDSGIKYGGTYIIPLSPDYEHYDRWIKDEGHHSPYTVHEWGVKQFYRSEASGETN